MDGGKGRAKKLTVGTIGDWELCPGGAGVVQVLEVLCRCRCYCYHIQQKKVDGTRLLVGGCGDTKGPIGSRADQTQVEGIVLVAKLTDEVLASRNPR